MQFCCCVAFAVLSFGCLVSACSSNSTYSKCLCSCDDAAVFAVANEDDDEDEEEDDDNDYPFRAF